MDIADIFRQKPSMKLTLKGDKCELYRLNDEQYYHLSQDSLPIKDNFWALFRVQRHYQQENQDLTLPKMYVLLTFIAGETSKFYDDWKGSFCFPFLIRIKKKTQELNNHLFIISDWRGNLEFRFKRLIGENENYVGIERDIVRQPFESEFSREEIDYFIVYFYSYLVGYFEGIGKIPHDNFFKHIDSNLILYGSTNGQFWEKYYEEYDYYHQRLEELQLQYPN